MTVIRLVIDFDSYQFRADFTSEETAYDWVATTLRRLLHEYGISAASRIVVRRAG